MSRTIRRKNYAGEHGKFEGSKTALSWTYAEFHSGGNSGHIWWHTYRPMTKEERKEEYLKRHSDKGDFCYRRRSSRTHKQGRRNEEHIHRSQCETQIIRFMKGLLEDVVLPQLMKKQSWYW